MLRTRLFAWVGASTLLVAATLCASACVESSTAPPVLLDPDEPGAGGGPSGDGSAIEASPSSASDSSASGGKQDAGHLGSAGAGGSGGRGGADGGMVDEGGGGRVVRDSGVDGENDGATGDRDGGATDGGARCSPVTGLEGPFGPLTMFAPPTTENGPSAFYARAIQLHTGESCNGRMYATFERYFGAMPTFPIYESKDLGRTWNQISEVADTVNGWGLRYQPFLYELPQELGSLARGTVLIAGNSIPSNFSKTKIDIYSSTDGLKTWKFVSSVVSAGRASMGADPVWEPFLMVANNKLICYYSDETDPAHDQKLVHKTSTDGIHWSDAVDDVALSDARLRPGMAVVAELANGKYIYTYEDPPRNRAYFKISDDPESWNPRDEGTPFGPGGSPYVAVMPNGTVVASASGNQKVYINTLNGAGTWSTLDAPIRGYSRALVPLQGGGLFMVVAGDWGGTRNKVTYGEIVVR